MRALSLLLRKRLTEMKSVDKAILISRIQHMERGKFEILATENDVDKYINKIVDGSDVFSCKST
jgi:hypothetical protein